MLFHVVDSHGGNHNVPLLLLLVVIELVDWTAEQDGLLISGSLPLGSRLLTIDLSSRRLSISSLSSASTMDIQ